MSHKSPSKIRKDLEAARSRLAILIGVLDSNASEKHWDLGAECKKAGDSLRDLLRDNEIPQDYKVAVIGRFKAGKSAFVNEMLGRKLAGEDTSPETAAVTMFTHGERVRANINLVDKTIWDALKSLHDKDATDPEAQRVANWLKFGGKDRSGPSAGPHETFDLVGLERQHVRHGGKTLPIILESSSDSKVQQKYENEFRRKIKEYTSGSKPHHCLVELIEIETPSPILGEGVTLVDTPGLDDTERFRVQLTERAVQNVDAVLFLTKSGAAYGQSEKDFLLSLLRKGDVKQVIFVVTQVDQTYEQHVRQARDQDEEPQKIGDRIELERRRIRKEIESTLDELDADSGSNSVQRYREQLSAIEIAFTSAANHRDWVRNETVRFPIAIDDPGGMKQVKGTLFKILSTESRLAAARLDIQKGTESILQKMLSVVENRRSVVRGLKNREVAENKLATFRDKFQQNGKEFADLIQEDCAVLRAALKNRGPVERLAAENISLQADVVLASYETDDAGRHWRTRRGGNWGYMHELQSRVANKIFPKVAEQLNAQTDEFSDFIKKFRVHLRTLSDGAETITEKLDIGEDFRLDMAGSLEKFLKESLDSLQTLIAGEEARIVALLENFADEEVEQKITEARSQVSGIWGKGTTISQTSEVRAFYRGVRSILRAALSSHVLRRFGEFSEHLINEGESLPKRALSQVQVQIERASADIRAAAEAAIAGQKDAFDRTANTIITDISVARADVASLLEADADSVVPPAPIIVGPPDESPPHDAVTPISALPTGTFSPDEIRERATKCVGRFRLKNGVTGWPFSRIFLRGNIGVASECWLVDPYLGAPHQRRNLKEFIYTIVAAAKLKTINIVTGMEDAADVEPDREFFARLDQRQYEQTGTRIKLSRTLEAHDRFVIFDSGIVFKLGRGLDIYKPAVGLASVNPDLRRVRECEIDVFGEPEA